MRLISLVPSWTETLIEAYGIESAPLVGRTRFCIHPEPKAFAIPAVGGTKDVDWALIQRLKPTHLILDQDENPLFFYEKARALGIGCVVTHVTSLVTAANGLNLLAKLLQEFASPSGSPNSLAASKQLSFWASSYEEESRRFTAPHDLPGILKWWRKPGDERPADVETLYMIWKKPWMIASRQTFIGDMLYHCGQTLQAYPSPYPEVDLAKKDPKRTVLLLSSEPFPFAQVGEADSQLQCFPRALIDGEIYSWFGIRALRALKNRQPTRAG